MSLTVIRRGWVQRSQNIVDVIEVSSPSTLLWRGAHERYPNRRMRRSRPVARLDPDEAVNRSFVCTGVGGQPIGSFTP